MSLKKVQVIWQT